MNTRTKPGRDRQTTSSAWPVRGQLAAGSSPARQGRRPAIALTNHQRYCQTPRKLDPRQCTLICAYRRGMPRRDCADHPELRRDDSHDRPALPVAGAAAHPLCDASGRHHRLPELAVRRGPRRPADRSGMAPDQRRWRGQYPNCRPCCAMSRSAAASRRSGAAVRMSSVLWRGRSGSDEIGRGLGFGDGDVHVPVH